MDAQPYFPLCVRTHYSALQALSQPHQVGQRLVQAGLPGCALTDNGVLGGVIALGKGLNSTCKHCGHQKAAHDHSGRCVVPGVVCPGFEGAKFKQINGLTVNVSSRTAADKEEDNAGTSTLLILAKNADGWRELVRAANASHRPENQHRKPRLSLEEWAAFGRGNWVVLSGHPGSWLANQLWTDAEAAYSLNSLDDVRGLLQSDWRGRAVKAVGHLRELFGPDNVFVEAQLVDSANMPGAVGTAACLRRVARDTGARVVATPSAHYATAEQASDHRLLLAIGEKKTLRELQEGGRGAATPFFRSNRYHIPSAGELVEAGNTPDELAATLAVAEMCEAVRVEGPPVLPSFPCPDGVSPDDHLKALCRDGWRRKIVGKVPAGRVGEYGDRAREELGVLTGAGLAGYFLIVHDYCGWARGQGMLVDARGSGAGCLVSYLLDISTPDPVVFHLDFTRFYNAGRNTPGKAAIPDIDVDFPSTRRAEVLDYIRRKYGRENVVQIAAYSRIQGRAAIKDVLGAHGAVSFAEANLISEAVPDESKVSDDLQAMVEEEGESSLIRWALENRPKDLAPYCKLDGEGNLVGEYATQFAQAIRLEGTIRHRSRHPGGVIISTTPLADSAPLVHDDKIDEMILGVDMREAEAMGLVKFDVLGVAVLDKLAACRRLVAGAVA
jgi:DNA polymerase-3 subunit alpha